MANLLKACLRLLFKWLTSVRMRETKREKERYGWTEEPEWRGNEPWSEVKSKAEAHLLQSDDSKTNEAQRESFKKPHLSRRANPEPAH